MPLLKSRKSYRRLDDDQEDSGATKGLKKLSSGLSSKFAKENLKYKLPGISIKTKCDLNAEQELQKDLEGNTTHQLFDQVQEQKDSESASYVSLFSCDDINNVNNRETTHIEPSDHLSENIYASISEDIYSTINDSTASSENYLHDDEYTVVNDVNKISHMSILKTKKSVYQRISEDDANSDGNEEYEKVGRIVSSESGNDKQRFLTRCRSMFDLITDKNFNKNFIENVQQLDHNTFNKMRHPQSTLKCSNVSLNDEKRIIDKDTNDKPSDIEYTDEEIYSTISEGNDEYTDGGIYSTISETIETPENDHYESVDDVVSSTWVYETLALLDNVMKGDHIEEENIGKEAILNIKPRREVQPLRRCTLHSRSNLSTSCFDLRATTVPNMSAKVSQKCHESVNYNIDHSVPSNLCRTSGGVRNGSILEINFESPIVNLKNSLNTNIEEKAPPLPLKEKIRYDVKLSNERSDYLLEYRQNTSGTFDEDQNKQPIDSTLYQTPIRADVHKASESHEILRDLRHGLMKSERPLRESAIFYTKAQPYPGNHSPGADTKKL